MCWHSEWLWSRTLQWWHNDPKGGQCHHAWSPSPRYRLRWWQGESKGTEKTKSIEF